MNETPLAAPPNPTEPARPVRPNARFMLAHPAHFIALGFGSGLSPIAPGTAGTLWAWLAYLVLQQWLSPVQIGWLIAVSLPVGWWACTVTSTTCARPIAATSSGTKWPPSGSCCGW